MKKGKFKFNLNFFGAALLFFLFWIAVSGSLHWQQLLLGAATVLFIAYFNRSLLIEPAERPAITGKSLAQMVLYCLRLLWEIVKANFQVAAIVLHPRLPISPQMVELEVDLHTTGCRVLLGNSITLTPGTLTVLAEQNRFVIHALTIDAGAGLAGWDLIKDLKQIEGELP